MTDPEINYTAAFHARSHLHRLSQAFADGNRTVEPDPEVCRAEEHLDEFTKLVRQWHRCQDAAHVINSRYRQDWDHGGALTVIAPKVREVSLAELTSVWNSLCATYIRDTLDADRKPWDCTFCGESVDPEPWYADDDDFDDDRCPNCMCILQMNRAGTDWEETH